MALCDGCRGKGRVRWLGQMIPCPFCFGAGISHCCDGLAAQADRNRGTPLCKIPQSKPRFDRAEKVALAILVTLLIAACAAAVVAAFLAIQLFRV